MSEVVSMISLWAFVIVGFTVFFILVKKDEAKRRKMQSIYAAITVSQLASIHKIARTLGLDVKETRELIESMISKAGNNDKDYRALKNAYIDHRKGEIVLDRQANKNIVDKTIDSVLQRFKPKQETWLCRYCETRNQGKHLRCDSCGAVKDVG